MPQTHGAKRRKPPFSLVLTDELEYFLRAQAIAAYRTLTKEITMRLEQSKALDLCTPPKAEPQPQPMQQPEKGEAMFAPTNTASMNAPTPSKVKDPYDE